MRRSEKFLGRQRAGRRRRCVSSVYSVDLAQAGGDRAEHRRHALGIGRPLRSGAPSPAGGRSRHPSHR
ncbi:hypothetical protein ACU4GD_26090 [Cupriavidus basilensis]